MGDKRKRSGDERGPEADLESAVAAADEAQRVLRVYRNKKYINPAEHQHLKAAAADAKAVVVQLQARHPALDSNQAVGSTSKDPEMPSASSDRQPNQRVRFSEPPVAAVAVAAAASASAAATSSSSSSTSPSSPPSAAAAAVASFSSFSSSSSSNANGSNDVSQRDRGRTDNNPPASSAVVVEAAAGLIEMSKPQEQEQHDDEGELGRGEYRDGDAFHDWGGAGQVCIISSPCSLSSL